MGQMSQVKQICRHQPTTTTKTTMKKCCKKQNETKLFLKKVAKAKKICKISKSKKNFEKVMSQKKFYFGRVKKRRIRKINVLPEGKTMVSERKQETARKKDEK